MVFNEPLLLIIVAGLMNGSFVVPSKLIGAPSEKIWLYHSIIGLVVIPWVLLLISMPKVITAYTLMSLSAFALLIFNGFVFGVGQLCFAYAIEKIGIALSFTINIGLGLVVGSLSIIIYKSALFTVQGGIAILAIGLILSGLIVHYACAKHSSIQKCNTPVYRLGWLLALLAGLASGLQNFTFIFVGFHLEHAFKFFNAYWVWPPFLAAAAIPMFCGFLYRLNKQPLTQFDRGFIGWSNLGLVALMGLLFTGSLLLYSMGMTQFSNRVHIVGWPTFMVSIILASQLWGQFFRESTAQGNKERIGHCLSIVLLVAAIVLLTFTQ